MGTPVTTAPVTMHLMILVSLAAAATASPQIVPYEHVEIAAEPYVHQEIEALPYVQQEQARGCPSRCPRRSPAVRCSSGSCSPAVRSPCPAIRCPCRLPCCRSLDWNLPQQPRSGSRLPLQCPG